MIEAFLAALGAVFTALSSIALGLIILRLLSVPLTRLEHYVFAFFTGSALFSLVVFLLTAAHAAYTLVFVLAGLTCMAIWLVRFRTTPAVYEAAQPLPKLWLIFALVLSSRYILLYVSRALGPEYSYDGSTYHLALVATYLHDHHFPVITTNMYASFPEGLEMLFLAAFSIGRHSAAATTHLLILFATGTAFVSFGARFRIAKAGIATMVLFGLAPIVGFDGSVAYNDVALAGACFITFYALQLWVATDNDSMLVLAGCAAGFAGSIKYTGFIASVFALAFVLWKSRRRLTRLRPRLLLLVIPAALLIAPWLAKNVVEVGNPLAPFANRIFPNPNMHVSFEEGYRRSMAHFNNIKLSEIPIEVTLKGGRIQGLLGPVFLLAPIALFALGSPIGRQILLAFGVFLLPYFSNIGTRFLLPSLPFLCLAMSMVLASWRASLAPVLLLQFLICWPRIVGKYAPESRGPDGLDAIRWDETFREFPQEFILQMRIPGYDMARFIDRTLPSSARIFQFGGVPGAYMRQRVDEFYEGAQNEKATFLLWSGAYPDLRPTLQQTFRFTPVSLRSLRIEQTASDKEELWEIAGVQLFSAGQQVAPQPGWKLSSRPFPWDVGLAFDSNPVTVWKSWDPIRPGMFVQVQFARPTALDQVDIESQHQKFVRLVLKGVDSSGKEVTLSEHPVIATIPTPRDYTQKVEAELKNLGYTHLVIGKSQPCYSEIMNNLAAWNMTLVAKRGEYALFSLN